jgi:hypothetical protein
MKSKQRGKDNTNVGDKDGFFEVNADGLLEEIFAVGTVLGE